MESDDAKSLHLLRTAGVLIALYVLIASGEPGVKVLRIALAAAEQKARQKQYEQLLNNLRAYAAARQASPFCLACCTCDADRVSDDQRCHTPCVPHGH